MANKKTLALVIIAKNEELGLAKAVASCRDFVDEIVIAVDNSSNDKTLEIAKQLADVTKTFDWKDDFSAARNFAHQGVKSDWILFLDGHEYVSKVNNLDEFLNKDTDGLLCTVELESGSQIRNVRIYKNGLQFHGAVHEIQNYKHPIFYPQFVIKHGRISGQSIPASIEREKQRDDQVPRILGAELKKNKKNIRASFHLALHAQSKGNFKQAIKYQNFYLKYSVLSGERYFVYFNRALCFLALGKNFRAFWSSFQADKETPNRWETSKLRGLVYFQSKKYDKALAEFVNSFKINTGDVSYKPWKRDNANTWNLIGECFFNLKNYYKAFVAFDKASTETSDPQFKEFVKKRSKLMYKIATKNPQ